MVLPRIHGQINIGTTRNRHRLIHDLPDIFLDSREFSGELENAPRQASKLHDMVYHGLLSDGVRIWKMLPNTEKEMLHEYASHMWPVFF